MLRKPAKLLWPIHGTNNGSWQTQDIVFFESVKWFFTLYIHYFKIQYTVEQGDFECQGDFERFNPANHVLLQTDKWYFIDWIEYEADYIYIERTKQPPFLKTMHNKPL